MDVLTKWMIIQFTGADATVYVQQEQIQRYTVCPTGADATVYVRQEQMQRYMSSFFANFCYES